MWGEKVDSKIVGTSTAEIDCYESWESFGNLLKIKGNSGSFKTEEKYFRSTM